MLTVDDFIHNTVTPITFIILYITLGLLMVSLTIRTISAVVFREIAIRKLQRGEISDISGYDDYDDTDDTSVKVALNVYFPNEEQDQQKMREDRGMKENIEEDTGIDATIGVKRYKVDISPIPTSEQEFDELERRREMEYNKFLQSLSDKEKEELQNDMDSHISKSDIISYQEMYLVYKGIEKEYRSKMINRLNNLETNLNELQGLIVRGGVSENNSIIYMKRYRLMRREIELYKTIIEHDSLLRKLFDIESQLRRLVNSHPFLVKGYSAIKNTPNRVKLKVKPIDKSNFYKEEVNQSVTKKGKVVKKSVKVR